MPSKMHNNFSSPENLQNALINELSAYTNAIVNVRYKTSFGNEGIQKNKSEYEVNIRVPGIDDAFVGTIAPGPNDTVKFRAGEGFYLQRGDLAPVSEAGIDKSKDPFISGFSAFTRRLAGAIKISESEQGSKYKNSINSNFMDIINNAGQTGKYIPGVGVLPPSGVWVSEHESPENINYLANTYNVAITGDRNKAIKALHSQVNMNPPVDMTQAVPEGWSRLFGGGVNKETNSFITPLAGGESYLDQIPGFEQGQWKVAGITPKFQKHTYVAGRRPIANFTMVTPKGLQQLPDEMLSTPSFNIRPDQQDYKGMVMQGLTAVGGLPWQSGQMQVQLPEHIRQYVLDQGGSLGAGVHGRKRISIDGAKDLQSLLTAGENNAGLSIKPNLGRFPIDAGQQIQVGSLGEKPLTIQNKQQTMGIRGANLHLPQAWGSSDEMIASQAPELDILRKQRGVNEIFFDSPSGAYLDVLTETVTTPGWKGAGAKGAQNIPLLGGMKQTLQSGGKSVDYDFLQEAKSIDAVVLNALQTMPVEGKGGLTDLVSYLMPDKRNLASSYIAEQQAAQRPLDLQGLAKSMKYDTGMGLLSDLTSGIIQTDDQGNPLAYDKMKVARNTELIRRFAIGRMQGVVPVDQLPEEDWNMYKQEMIRAIMSPAPSSGYEGVDKETAEARFQEVIGQYSTTDKGIRTIKAMGEYLYHPALKTAVPETSGKGSDQLDFMTAMKNQGFKNVADFLQQNQNSLFPAGPARKALQQIAGSYIQSASGSIDLANSIMIGRGPGAINPTDLFNNIVARTTDMGQVEKLSETGNIIREMAGLKKGDPMGQLYFQSQKMSIANPESWATVESLKEEITERGEVMYGSQGQISFQANRVIDELLSSEMHGEINPLAKTRAMMLGQKYINSDQLRKMRGGLFSRFGVSSMVSPGKVFLSDDYMRRNFLEMGGDINSGKDYMAYLKSMRNSSLLAVRPPNPFSGTEGMPGSIMPLQVMSRFTDKMGYQMAKSIRQSGIKVPEVFMSALSSSTLGDADLDPLTTLPLTFRMGKGKYVSYNDAEGESYEQFLKKVMANASPELQNKTFDRLFGALASESNPWDDKGIRPTINNVFGDKAAPLLEKRLSMEFGNLTSAIEERNLQKTEYMGSTYNTYRRRLLASGATMGGQERFYNEISALGATYYQRAVDMEHYGTTFEHLMSSGGLYKQGQNMVYGFYGADDKMKVVSQLSSEDSSFTFNPAVITSKQKEMRPELLAGMYMTGDKDMTDDQMFEKQKIISSRLEKVWGNERATEKEITSLYKEGLLGDESLAGISLATRATEYAMADPERAKQLQELTQTSPINFGGKKYTLQGLHERLRPASLLHEFSLNRSDKTGFMDKLSMAEVFHKSRIGGYAGSQQVQNLWHSYGQAAGLPNPNLKNVSMISPRTGLPREIQNMADIAELRQEGISQMATYADAFIQGRGGVSPIPLSSLGAMTNFVPGEKYTDQVLGQSLAYGMKNPALFDMGLGLSGRPGDYFQTGGAASALGGKVEGMVGDIGAKISGLSGVLGSPYKQAANKRTAQYQIQGDAGEMSFSGRPDFFGIKETRPGEFDLQVTDWKNLSSLSGKQRKTIEANIRGNESYMQQLEGYGLMVGNRAMITPEMEAHMRETLQEDPESLKALENYLNPDYEAKSVNVRTGLAVTTFKPGESDSSMKGKLTTGLKQLAKGVADPKNITMVDLGRREMTPEYVAEAEGRFYEDLKTATGVRRENLLKASQYQSYVVKQGILSNSDYLREMGGSIPAITKEESEAYDYFKSQYNTPHKLRTDLDPVEARKLLQGAQANIAMLSGGGGGQEPPIGGRGGGVAPPPDDDGSSSSGSSTPSGGGRSGRGSGTRAGAQNAANVMDDTNFRMLQALNQIVDGLGKGGKSPFYGGGKTIDKELAGELIGSAKTFMPLVGKLGEGGALAPGDLIEQYGQVKNQLAALFDDDASKQEIMGADRTSSALAVALKRGKAKGMNIRKLIQDSPVGRFIEDANVVGKSFAEATQAVPFADPGTLGDFTTEDQLLASVATGNPTAVDKYPAAARMFSSAKVMKSTLSGVRKLTKEEEALSSEELALGKQRNEMYKNHIGLMKEHSKTMSNYSKNVEDITAKIDDLIKSGGETAQLAKKARFSYDRASFERNELATELRKATGITGGGIGDLTEDEREQIANMATTKGTTATFRKYEAASEKAALAEYGMLNALEGKDVEGKGAPNYGSIARRVLGGFGIMFMRSLSGIAASPLQYGYQEGMQQDATYEGIAGAAYGGFSDVGNIENRIAQLKAESGGMGWTNLRRVQADMMQNQPGIVQAGNLMGAAVGGAGLVGWLGGMMAPGVSMAPWMGGAAALAGGLALGGNYLGARSDVEGNASQISRMIASGKYMIHNGRVVSASDNIFDQLSAGLDMNTYAYNVSASRVEREENPNTLRDAGIAIGKATGLLGSEAFRDPTEEDRERVRYQKTREGLRDYLSVPFQNNAVEYLKAAGYSTAEAGSFLSEYSEDLLISAGSTVSDESGAKAQAALAYFGRAPRQGELSYLAEMYQQNIDIKGLSQLMATDIYTSGAEQHADAGEYSRQFITEERRTPTTREVEEYSTGRERFLGLGIMRPDLKGDERDEYERKLYNLSTAGWSSFATGAKAQEARRKIGLSYKLPDVDAIAGMSPDELVDYDIQQENLMRRTQYQTQIHNNYMMAGFESMPSLVGTETMTMGQLQGLQQQQQQASALAYRFVQTGMSTELGGAYERAMMGMEPDEYRRYSGLLSMDPQSFAKWAKNIPEDQQSWLSRTVVGAEGGQKVPLSYLGMTDLDQQGNITGLSWGTTTFQLPGMSAMEVGQDIWGSDRSAYGVAGNEMINAAVSGIESPFGNLQGMQAIKYYQMQEAKNARLAQTGIQMQQLETNFAFQTGVGLGNYNTINPVTGSPFQLTPGGLWGVQDRSQELGYARQEYGFDMQQRQMGMQDRFFWSNAGLQQEQMQMGRSFARDDWAFQDTTRALSWQWKQEDFAENIRFTSGRERRLGERQMRRESTMHDLEGEQIDRKREQQESLWQLEDDRFDLQKEQHQESLKLQEEQLEKNREFFEEQKILDQQQKELQRALWIEQIELQKQATATAASYAQRAEELQLAMMALELFTANASGAISTLNPALAEIVEILKDFDPELAAMIEQQIQGNVPEESETSRGEGVKGGIPRAHGGVVVPGQTYEILEREDMELFRANTPGEIYTQDQVDPWLRRQPFSDPSSSSSSPVIVTVPIYIGQEHIKDIVIRIVNDEVEVIGG